jgi:histidinol dehydrogenase
MSRILDTREAGFAAAFRSLAEARGATGGRIAEDVAALLEDVRRRGFSAVADATARFDGVQITPQNARRGDADTRAALDALPAALRGALELAAARIRAFHEAELEPDRFWTDDAGVGVGWRWRAVDAAGLYAPGGKAAYPSSVLMNALPAQVAGVGRRVMVTPPRRARDNPAILGAAHLAGVTEIWAIGGAQAIAALAYGADPIAPVDIVVGPGNAHVAEAKRQVFGHVGIDSVAGPSEVVIIADPATPPRWIAYDLLAQAEHDELAQSLLFTDDPAHACAVLAAVEAILAAGDAGAPARAAWQAHGAVIVTRGLDEAAELADTLAPEHLQLALAPDRAWRLAERIRHAGAIFVGVHAAEALGDYIAGPNHVLPTQTRARFASGLSARSFQKRTTLVAADAAALAAIGPAAAVIADHEGLPAHAGSLRVRLEGP